MTPQELIAYIEGLIIDNNNQSVTPYKMRSVLIEMVNSLNQSNISSLSAVLPLVYDPFTNTLSLPVVNNLTAGGTNAVLSAEQGKILKQLIDDIVISGGGVTDAPNDGKLYGRQSLSWTEANLQSITDGTGNNTTTNPISVTDVANDKVTGVNGNLVSVADLTTSELTALESDGISFINAGGASGVKLKSSSQTGNVGEVLIPDAGTTTKIIAFQEYVDAEISAAVAGLLDDRGNHDASSNTFPSSGGSGTAGAILKGDLWTISVAGSLGGVAVTVGDVIRAKVDTPGTTSSNWVITENNIGYVPENNANKSNDLGDAASTTKFPVWSVVASYVTSALVSFKTANFLDFTSSGQTQLDGKENTTNKGNVIGNLTSTTIYPHAKAVVDYVDTLRSVFKNVPTTQNITSTTGTIVNFMSFTLEANSKYLIRGSFRIFPSNLNGAKCAFQVGTGTTTFGITVSSRLNTNTAPIELPLYVSGTLSSAFNTAASANFNHKLEGIITTGANADTIDFIIACGASSMSVDVLPETAFELIKL